MGHREMSSQTVDTTLTVQVCQCYLVLQLRVEFLRRANDQPEKIHSQSRALLRDIMMLD